MKRNLILTFLACGASLALCSAAQGQTPSTPVTSSTCGDLHDGPGGNHRQGGGVLQHLTYALDLSGSQQAEIAPILEAAKPQMKAIRDEAKKKREALIDSVSTQITPLLTPDQQTKFSQLVEKFKAGPGPGKRPFARRGGKGGPGAPGAPGAQDRLQHLTAALGLTSDQQTQIKPILEAAGKQVKSIFTDTTMTREQKFAKAKETFEAANGQINGILTPAQQTQFAAMKEKMHRRFHGPDQAPPTPGRLRHK